MKNHANSPVPLLTFRLGDQPYALFIEEVVEVASMVELTVLPDSPPAMLGIANRHGVVLPLFDLRLIFGKEVTPINPSTLFIVATHSGQLAGLVVDDVHQVEYMDRGELRAVPTAGKYIRDIVNHKGQLVQIIALSPLLAALLPDGMTDEGLVEDR